MESGQEHGIANRGSSTEGSDIGAISIVQHDALSGGGVGMGSGQEHGIAHRESSTEVSDSEDSVLSNSSTTSTLASDWAEAAIDDLHLYDTKHQDPMANLVVKPLPGTGIPNDQTDRLAILPHELLSLIFSCLDPLDCVSTALSSPHLWRVFKILVSLNKPPRSLLNFNTPISLNLRRSGPNKLEACWEIVGCTACRHCGVERCELW